MYFIFCNKVINIVHSLLILGQGTASYHGGKVQKRAECQHQAFQSIQGMYMYESKPM